MSWLRQKFSTAKRGFFEKMQSIIQRQDRVDWNNFNFEEYSKRFDDYCSRYPKVKSALLTVAGQVVADGVYTSIEDDYPRAQDAKRVCDEFNKRVGMYLKIRKTAMRMVKYGTAFWELDWNNVNGLNVQLIPHQEHMKPVYMANELSGWEYAVNHVTIHKWPLSQIAVFPLDPEENDPFGTSLLTGIDYELGAQDEIRSNLLAYLKKQAFASNVLQVGDGTFTPQQGEIDTIRSEVKNRKVGEDFVTSYPIGLQVMAAAAVETRMIPDTLKFTDDQVTDALMAPPISKLYNSTEASATVMTDWARANLITPIQNIIREVIEKQVYQPMLEDQNFTVKLTPTLSFDPPDVHTNEEANYYKALYEIQAQTPEQICKALGLKYDKAYWDAKKQEEEAKMQAQLDAKTEQTKPQEKPKVAELMETLRASETEDQFMTSCKRVVDGWVKDPEDFCGAFWRDGKQWYHGPQKTDFVGPVKEYKIIEYPRRTQS